MCLPRYGRLFVQGPANHPRLSLFHSRRKARSTLAFVFGIWRGQPCLKIYIQVSDDISEPKTLYRELEPLGKIRDSYPKLLIARTRHAETDREGVRIVDIARWLEG